MDITRIQVMCSILKNILIGFTGKIEYINKPGSWGCCYFMPRKKDDVIYISYPSYYELSALECSRELKHTLLHEYRHLQQFHILSQYVGYDEAWNIYAALVERDGKNENIFEQDAEYYAAGTVCDLKNVVKIVLESFDLI